MSRTKFSRVRAGDVVLLTNPNPEFSQNVTMAIADVSYSHNYGWCIRDADEADYFEEDGYTVALLHWARGLPDTDFFTWSDPDTGPHVAIRLPEDMWSVDGQALAHDETIARVNGAESRVLTVRK